jgi:hypothetical protein
LVRIRQEAQPKPLSIAKVVFCFSGNFLSMVPEKSCTFTHLFIKPFKNPIMAKEKEAIEFDDTEAINFILNSLPEESRAKISDDDVQYLLDLVCEYYDSNNLIEDDAVGEATIAEDEMFDFIWKLMKKENQVNLTEEELQQVLDGEFEYGKKIGIYTEE